MVQLIGSGMLGLWESISVSATAAGSGVVSSGRSASWVVGIEMGSALFSLRGLWSLGNWL